jgi:exodeoxyribonuclease VII large subunit
MTKQRVIPPFTLTPRRTDDRQSSFSFSDLPSPLATPPAPAPTAPEAPVAPAPVADAAAAPAAPAPPLPVKTPPSRVVWQVSDAVGRAARVLEDNFSDVWIEGEIEGFKRHNVSGNCYFALKDGGARLESMLRRAQAQQLRTPLRDGLKIRARGRLTLYKEQGRFQFYIEEVELSGEGELLQQFEELKARLARQGLFDPARKRRLPRFPRVIGLATSSSGAALHDILRVANRRGKVRFLVANCAVQGPSAPPQIAAAIDRLAPHVDVIIVGRGGGSVADLWAFNDEAVAHAIYRCPVPVVSAVGHEVDFTIADFVADVRAPTPSAAAELCVPDFAALEAECGELAGRLMRAGRRHIDGARQQLDGELGRAQVSLERQLGQRRRLLSQVTERLQSQHPKTQLGRDRASLKELQQRIDAALRLHVLQRRQALAAAGGKLDALSPLKVLGRGYALARDQEGHILSDAAEIAVGEPLSVMLHRGTLHCRVEDKDTSAG